MFCCLSCVCWGEGEGGPKHVNGQNPKRDQSYWARALSAAASCRAWITCKLLLQMKQAEYLGRYSSVVDALCGEVWVVDLSTLAPITPTPPKWSTQRALCDPEKIVKKETMEPSSANEGGQGARLK